MVRFVGLADAIEIGGGGSGVVTLMNGVLLRYTRPLTDGVELGIFGLASTRFSLGRLAKNVPDWVRILLTWYLGQLPRDTIYDWVAS